MIVLVIEHTNSPGKFTKRSRLNKAFTVLYSRTPYTNFFPLFFGQSEYDGNQIHAIPGIFYNHQLKHFDVTVIIDAKEENDQVSNAACKMQTFTMHAGLGSVHRL